MTRQIEACVLCGQELEPRVMALVEWTEPVGSARWSSIPRCVDRAGCRRRVELVVCEPWPVNDRTPAPERDPDPTHEPEAVPWLA